MKAVYSAYGWKSINDKYEIYNKKILMDVYGNILITIGHYKSEKPTHWQIAFEGRLNYVFTPKEINQDFLDYKKLMLFVQTRLEEYFSKALIK